MPTVPKDHWESLQGTIEDLKTLSELHEDSSIANVAKKLYQLIDANIQVIEGKVEKILKGSPDLIPSPSISVKIQSLLEV